MIDAFTIRGGPIFDGAQILTGAALRIEDGRVSAIGDEADLSTGPAIDLAGDLLCPAYVDLQVNGGGGVMFNDAPALATLRTIARAHRRLGTGTILPTLISDTPSKVRAAIDAVEEAVAAGTPGIGGLHLEGPHIAAARKGAHDRAAIRPMEDADLDLLVAAAARLPRLMVTLAPEAARPDQVRALADAGAVVSLGHTDADLATCLAYAEAGASCATHLFNAMSQLGSRAPGLVGAALTCGGLSAGLIADGHHVHPASLRIALAAKAGPGTLFAVSDAMAVAGTDDEGFVLHGRPVRRRQGRLTLDDGTLAGADLDLTTAAGVLAGEAGLPLNRALAMVTSLPAAEARMPPGTGRIAEGASGPLLRLAMVASRPQLRAVLPLDLAATPVAVPPA